jgi:hypothetical protein
MITIWEDRSTGDNRGTGLAGTVRAVSIDAASGRVAIDGFTVDPKGRVTRDGLIGFNRAEWKRIGSLVEAADKPIAEVLMEGWSPSSLELSVVEEEFGQLVIELGYRWDDDTTIKAVRGTPQPDQGLHYDGVQPDNLDIAPDLIIAWASELGTYIEDAVTGEEFKYKKRDVVKIRNKKAKHRVRPEIADYPNRVFVKAWISYEDGVNRH